MTELCAKLVGSAGLVVAFEAHPENVQLLRENIRANGCGNQVRVEHFAVSDGSRDRVWLFPGRQRSSLEWNIVGHDVEGIRTDAELEVPAISLDDSVPAGSALHLAHIDVEASEAHGVAG